MQNKFRKVYNVVDSIIETHNIIDFKTYTDSSFENTLGEITYDDFGIVQVSLVSQDDGESFQMGFKNRFVTTDIRNAIKVAVKGYKTLTIEGVNVIPLVEHFSEYIEKYPEYFV